MSPTFITQQRQIYEANALAQIAPLDKKLVQIWVDDLYDWLFGLNESAHNFAQFTKEASRLQKKFAQFIVIIQSSDTQTEKLSTRFFEDDLPNLHEILKEDWQAILKFDPAAQSQAEILLSHLGFYAVTTYRIAHKLHQYGLNILPRMMTEYAHSKTGIDIHPAASIGQAFMIDHGTGVVIGETCNIGNHVHIYQGVTLGALSVSKDKAETKRHPTVEDNVTIYANATILGGNTIIGKNSVIGGNVWLTESVPPDSLVYHQSQNMIKQRIMGDTPINFCI